MNEMTYRIDGEGIDKAQIKASKSTEGQLGFSSVDKDSTKTSHRLCTTHMKTDIIYL